MKHEATHSNPESRNKTMGRNWTTSDLADHYRRTGSPSPILDACSDGKRHKYGVSPKAERTVDGILFDSKREAHHYKALKIAEQAGVIQDLELQPVFLLQAAFRDETGKLHRRIEYRADFKFTRKLAIGQEWVVVDVKGVETPAFRLKWKLVLAKYPEYKWEIWK